MLSTGNLFLPVWLSVHIFGNMYTDRSTRFHMALILYFRLFLQIPWQCSISSHAAMANIWAWRKRICLRHHTPPLDVQQIESRIFYKYPQLWIPVIWFKEDVNRGFRRPCQAYACSPYHLHCNPLTYWGWVKMAAISQTFSNGFPECKYFYFD